MTIEEASLHHSVIKLQINDSHFDAVGSLMGCYLRDGRFCLCCRLKFRDRYGNLCFDKRVYQFLSASQGKELTAEAVCVKRGNRLLFFEVLISDELGKLVAKSSFTMCRVKQAH